MQQSQQFKENPTKCNAFRELPLIKTSAGTLSIEEALKRSGEKDLWLDQSVIGFEFSASWRLLSAITAVCLQIDSNVAKESSLPFSVIDKALATLSEAEDLFGGTYPFFQQPQVPSQKANKPAWKLSPTIPSDKSQTYWDLDKFKPETMSLPEAAMALIVFTTHSAVGNSRYNKAKCQNGAPGIHSPKVDSTATEFFIKSTTLYKSLLKSIPKTWIQPGGLPAWADRTGKKSTLPDGSMHPLWRATWSSNAAACNWSESRLLGVQIGGIPKAWFATEMGSTKERHKAWWDQRNTEDPFYLYRLDKKGNLKAEQLDLSKDLTALAVEWAKEKLTNSLDQWTANRVSTPDFRDDSLIFVRHRIKGQSTSLIIRESVITFPNPSTWGFADSPEVQEEITAQALFIWKLRDIVCNRFQRKDDRKQRPKKEELLLLDDLADLHPVAEDAFWREVTPAYADIITTLHDDDDNIELKLLQAQLQAIDCAKRAFNRVIEPYLFQNPNRNLRIQQFVMRSLNKEARLLTEEEEQL